MQINKNLFIPVVALLTLFISCSEETIDGVYEYANQTTITSVITCSTDGNYELKEITPGKIEVITGPYFLDGIDDKKKLVTLYFHNSKIYNENGVLQSEVEYPKMRKAIEVYLFDTYLETENGQKYKKNK